MDDDGDVRESVTDAVNSTGRRVVSVSGGAAALKLIEVPSFPRPCLILLDWVMTPMNGEEFLQHLRSRDDADHFRVLVTSGSMAVREGTIIPGVLGTLSKPFDLEKLLAILDEHC